MAVWCSLWTTGIFLPFCYVWTKKNLATLTLRPLCRALFMVLVSPWFWVNLFALAYIHQVQFLKHLSSTVS
jgi:hypothetical protein